MKQNFNWRRPFIIAIIIGVPFGIIWGVVAMTASSPNPPSWTKYASSVVGPLPAVICVMVYAILAFRKKQ
jgi:hypothetical protein